MSKKRTYTLMIAAMLAVSSIFAGCNEKEEEGLFSLDNPLFLMMLARVDLNSHLNVNLSETQALYRTGNTEQGQIFALQKDGSSTPVSFFTRGNQSPSFIFDSSKFVVFGFRYPYACGTVIARKADNALFCTADASEGREQIDIRTDENGSGNYYTAAYEDALGNVYLKAALDTPAGPERFTYAHIIKLSLTDSENISYQKAVDGTSLGINKFFVNQQGDIAFDVRSRVGITPNYYLSSKEFEGLENLAGPITPFKVRGMLADGTFFNVALDRYTLNIHTTERVGSVLNTAVYSIDTDFRGLFLTELSLWGNEEICVTDNNAYYSSGEGKNLLRIGKTSGEVVMPAALAGVAGVRNISCSGNEIIVLADNADGTSSIIKIGDEGGFPETTLLGSGHYSLKSANIAADGRVLFTGIAVSTGQKIFGEINSDGDLESVTPTASEVTSFVRIN